MMSYSDHCKLGKHDAFVMRLKLDEGLECDRFELDRESGNEPRYEATSTPYLKTHLISLDLLSYRLSNKGKCVICKHRRDPDE